MPQPVEVGSVLGGRYKVTGQVTTSADGDVVLDGVDQVLNRNVSILLAGPDHAEQVAESARDIATGERPGNMQMLDLGTVGGSTYLVTNHASAPDLLDLVVADNPPYVEPFYTDTLGTEIFGQPRSTEPDSYDDRYEHVRYDDETPAAGPSDAGRGVPPAPPTPPHTPATPPAKKPKVTLWSDGDYESDSDAGQHPGSGYGSTAAGIGAGAGAAGGRAAGAGGGLPGTGSARAASHFPAAARGGGYNDYEYDDEPDQKNEPKFTRWLVGGILAIVLIAAVVLAVGQLGTMFQPTAAESTGTTEQSQDAGAQTQAVEEPQPSQEESEPAEESPSPEQEVVEPVAASVTRLVPDAPDLDSANDDLLVNTIDGNPSTAWTSLLYANDVFGGFASNLALVVELEEQSGITEVQLQQLNGSGGRFEVLLNDEPSLEGAAQVAEGSFTAPGITVPIPEQDGQVRTAEYVIINFTQLPRLSNSNGPYPWGIKLAEIEIS